MIRKFFFEAGNWNEAGKILHERQPDKFVDVASAKNFLRDSVLAEYGDVAQDQMLAQAPWIYGPICALPTSSNQVTATERFDNLTIRFWYGITTNDRSPIEVFR